MSAWSDCLLYLVGYQDGRIKVGRTNQAQRRLRQHRAAKDYAWGHMFGPDTGDYESACKAAMKKVGQQIGRTEVFTGLDKTQAKAICRAVIYPDWHNNWRRKS
jgi:hypothetical protein